jgi:PHD/YefM family antitoxin component YafN of YafNO toxin-antitoxin module
MGVELTTSQQQALDAHNDEPVRIVDPRNQKVYVLVPAEEFARAQEALDELEDRAVQGAVTEAARRTAAKWMKENPY